VVGKILKYPVRVIEPLAVWSFAGGWADGPFVEHPGALLFLTYIHQGVVHFDCGINPPPWGINGGTFPEEGLSKVQRLIPRNRNGGVGWEAIPEMEDVGREALPPYSATRNNVVARTFQILRQDPQFLQMVPRRMDLRKNPGC
jgi:hypothetical protein